MIAEILANVLGGILTEAFSNVFQQPLKHLFDERTMHRALLAAGERAEEQFAREYRTIDAELTNALIDQTRFIDTPTVQTALQAILTRPFHDPTTSIATIHQSFRDVLPARVDRTRVDDAVNRFLLYVGQEVLYIPQLQPLYTLAFQKMSAESNRSTAANTAAIVARLQSLHEDMKALPEALPLAALPMAEQPAMPVSPWHNLPQRTYTQFVGRDEELQKLTKLLLPYPRSRHFLVTLDGIGGVGKSALALEIAYRYRESYSTLPPEERFEAIIWISAKRTLLTASGVQQRQQSFSTLGDLYREIATVLELPALLHGSEEQRRGSVEHALTGKRTLLILDNLETVDDEEVLTFLRELPDPTKAIVTTRHRIDIAYAIRLTGMSHADAHVLIELEAERKGIALFAEAIEDLYRRTGGIPLAIVWSLSLMSLGYGIESVLRRLGSGHSDIARFCFEESVAHIREHDAYRLFVALTLFESSVSRKMLGEVTGLGRDEIGRDDALAELLQLSLINQEGDRFSLLPLTRTFVMDELNQQAELQQILHDQWIAHFVALALPYADLHLRRHDLHLIRKEGVHFVTLSSWCQHIGRTDILLKVFPAAAFYYDYMGQWTDLLTIGQIVLEYAQLTGDLESIVYIETHVLSWVLSQQGHHEEAEYYIADALKTVKQLGDISRQCEVLMNYARVYRRRKLYESAFAYCEQALDLVQRISGTQQIYLRASVEYEVGKYYRDRCEWQAAQQHLYVARDVFRHDEIDPVFNMELAFGILSSLGFVEHQLGNLETAKQMYLQCFGFFKKVGGRGTMTTLLTRLASLEEQCGNQKRARGYAADAIEWSRRLGMVQEQAQAEAIFQQVAKKETQ